MHLFISPLDLMIYIMRCYDVYVIFVLPASIYIITFVSQEVVRCLLALGAEVNKGNEHGDTALHISALHKSPGRVKVLIEHGAFLDRTNKSGTVLLTVDFNISIYNIKHHLVSAHLL
jgi:ankyrin repeat protein